MTKSSTVARWELATRLRARRHELGIGVPTIVKELDFSRNFYSAVENERSMLSPEKLALLLELLQFSETDKAELIELDRLARRRDWWHQYVDLVGEDGVRFVGLEQGASRIRVFESTLIPGLLQIPAYTRAVGAVDPDLASVQIESTVELRQQRQRLIAADQLEYVALLSEAALLQQWAGPDVQRAQLQYLISASTSHSRVNIRVIPFTVNPGFIATASTVAILYFDSEHLPSLAYQEAVLPFSIVQEGDDQFARIRLAWEDGVNRSLDPDASIARIEQAASQI